MNKSCWMYLNPFNISNISSNCLGHFNSITSAVWSICSWEFEQVRSIFLKKTIRLVIMAISSCANNYASIFVKGFSVFFIGNTNNFALIYNQFSSSCFSNYSASLRCLFGCSLNTFNKGISNCHSWEFLFSSVSSFEGMSSQL